MHFLPILSTLRRHRTAAALIVIEIALTCAIVINAIYPIRQRLARMDAPSGVVEDELVRVRLTGVTKGADATAITAQDFAALRAIPGVKSVAATNQVPFGSSSWNSSISTKPEDHDSPVNATMYMGTPDLRETLGIELSAGRDFEPDEYQVFEDVQTQKVALASVILSRAAAERLYPGENPVGKKAYVWGKQPQTIVGIFEYVARPNQVNGPEHKGYAMLLPVNMTYAMGGNYLLRVDPARKAEVLAAVDAALDKVDPNRIILERQTFAEVRSSHFRQDRAMARLLMGVSIALLIVTALGIVGLASFWVQQRTRQIGIRRALGATRGDIVRYFQMENLILATIGIVIGMGLAYGINLWLMKKFQVEKLPAELLPIGALLLWMLGQVAVLGPALRASMIPPAIATRSV